MDPSSAEGTCYNHADVAWIGICTVLVLGMTPALGFFEAGLLRAKNTISIIVQCLAGFVLMSCLYFLVGYTLIFGPSQKGIIGNLDHVAFVGVSYTACAQQQPVPEIMFAIFQMMFAAITPLLMTGGFAERIRWKVFIAFILIWEVIVYYPIAHWIWGGGWLSKKALDFAGGIVIHVTAGAGSLVLSILLGKRQGFEKYHGEFPPSNVPLAATGAGLLYVGWFGFNAGSALASDASAIRAVASTQVAAVFSGLVYLLISWVKAKPCLVQVMNGIIAGCAGITPAAGFVDIQAAAVIGVIVGLASYGSVHLLKGLLHIDDALDVSSVHGVPGVVGSLAIGFATRAQYNPLGENGVIFGGHGGLLGWQAAAILIAFAWSAFWTGVLGLLLQHLPWGPKRLRIKAELEAIGLDDRYHGMAAYDFTNTAIEDELLLNKA